jgi:hypothetical protein
MMTSLLHQLENNEAILLMYVADELSAEDRADVEQQLATDGSLRAELERVRALQTSSFATLGDLDANTRLPVSEGVAVRRATRMIRQWQVDHATATPPEEEKDELRFPWWSYPLTTAAAVMIAFLVWWGNRSETPPKPNLAQQYQEPIPGPADLYALQAEATGDSLIESFDLTDDDLVRLAINQPVDAGIERLQSTANATAAAGSPNDVDAILLNAAER